MVNILRQDKEFYRSLLHLGLPLLAQNLVNQSLALVDTFMVGMAGEQQLAGVTLANTPFFVVMLMVFGFQSGSSVLFSQYWGKGDRTSINRIMGIGMYAAGGITLVVSILMLAFPEAIMSLTTNDQALVEIAAEYGRIVAFSYFLNSFSLIYIAALRSMENPKFGMYVLCVSMVCNTFFNWVFIFGNLGAPAMGAAGAALGTLLARVVELTITVIFALRNPTFQLEFKALLRPGKAICTDFFRYSAPVILNETLWGLGSSMYPIIIGHMENAATAVAAYTLAGNIERIAAVFMFAVGNSAAVLVGKEVGANRPKRAEEIGKTLMAVSFLCGLAVAVVLAILNLTIVTPYVLPIFKLDKAAQYVTALLFCTCAAMPFRACSNCAIVGVLRGGGDVKTAMLLDVLPLYLLGIPAAALCGLVLNLSVVWVYGAVCVEESLKGILGMVRIRGNKWIKNLTRDWDGETGEVIA